MSRKALIQSCIFLGVLCAALAVLPTALNALMRATNGSVPLRDPKATAASLLGANGDAPPTLSQWIQDRSGDDPAQLKIVGTGDPDMSVEERMRLLEDAEKNRPAIPSPGSKGTPPRSRKPRQPPRVLPAEDPDPEADAE